MVISHTRAKKKHLNTKREKRSERSKISGGSNTSDMVTVGQSKFFFFFKSVVSGVVCLYKFNHFEEQDSRVYCCRIEFSWEKFGWMTLVGVKIIWEHQCLLKLDKKSLKFLFVGICQLKVLPLQLCASNLKCENLVIIYYIIILVYKLFILKKLFVTRKFVLLGWQSKLK